MREGGFNGEGSVDRPGASMGSAIARNGSLRLVWLMDKDKPKLRPIPISMSAARRIPVLKLEEHSERSREWQEYHYFEGLAEEIRQNPKTLEAPRAAKITGRRFGTSMKMNWRVTRSRRPLGRQVSPRKRIAQVQWILTDSGFKLEFGGFINRKNSETVSNLNWSQY